MAPSSVNYAPFAAVTATLLALVLVIGLNTGLPAATLISLLLGIITAGLAWLTVVLGTQLHRKDAQSRNLRQIAERMQAMISSVPEGYCIFTTQGILREATRLAPLLAVDKVNHFEDLVAAIKDPEEFVAAFRKMQMTGEGFSLTVTVAKENKAIQVVGARMHFGRDALLLLDILWFSDNPVTTTILAQKNAELMKINAKLENVRAVYDRMPIPIWRRDGGIDIARCNKSYAKALDTTMEAVIKDQIEMVSETARGGSGRALAVKALESGAAQTERRHVIIAGKR
ncbi:MAG: hypothetical protein PHE27_09100 [Alphaproteobacteria bacterium]|nr:hypothetical protein [Alphaproteobacteria bacterium]